MLNQRFCYTKEGMVKCATIESLCYDWWFNRTKCNTFVFNVNYGWRGTQAYLLPSYLSTLAYDYGNDKNWHAFTTDELEQSFIVMYINCETIWWYVDAKWYMDLMIYGKNKIPLDIAEIICEYREEKPKQLQFNVKLIKNVIGISQDGWMTCKYCSKYPWNRFTHCRQMTDEKIEKHLNSDEHKRAVNDHSIYT